MAASATAPRFTIGEAMATKSGPDIREFIGGQICSQHRLRKHRAGFPMGGGAPAGNETGNGDTTAPAQEELSA